MDRREKYRSVTSRMHPDQGLNRNLGMCPDLLVHGTTLRQLSRTSRGLLQLFKVEINFRILDLSP